MHLKPIKASKTKANMRTNWGKQKILGRVENHIWSFGYVKQLDLCWESQVNGIGEVKQRMLRDKKKKKAERQIGSRKQSGSSGRGET